MLRDCVDGRPGKTKKTVPSTRDELGSCCLCQLNGLVLDLQAAKIDGIGTDITGSGAAVAVGNLP